ncbi:hypothetical protein F4803DRAFT_463990 [Xylaria telfairii]|nr:hypothetical protein F4803DRAFT_463990 [Xylaria telfairii]
MSGTIYTEYLYQYMPLVRDRVQCLERHCHLDKICYDVFDDSRCITCIPCKDHRDSRETQTGLGRISDGYYKGVLPHLAQRYRLTTISLDTRGSTPRLTWTPYQWLLSRTVLVSESQLLRPCWVECLVSLSCPCIFTKLEAISKKVKRSTTKRSQWTIAMDDRCVAFMLVYSTYISARDVGCVYIAILWAKRIQRTNIQSLGMGMGCRDKSIVPVLFERTPSCTMTPRTPKYIHT